MQRIFVDTYVKTYLRDGERWLQKRKTRVVRHTNEPDFRQTLRYSACDVLGRTLGNQTFITFLIIHIFLAGTKQTHVS